AGPGQRRGRWRGVGGDCLSFGGTATALVVYFFLRGMNSDETSIGAGAPLPFLSTRISSFAAVPRRARAPPPTRMGYSIFRRTVEFGAAVPRTTRGFVIAPSTFGEVIFGATGGPVATFAARSDVLVNRSPSGVVSATCTGALAISSPLRIV